MKRVLVGLTVMALPVVLAACGGDNSSGPTTQDAATSAAFSAIKGAVDQVNQNNANSFTTEAREFEATIPSDKPKRTKTVNTTVNCVGGGTATFTGTFTGATTGTNPATTNIIYTYTVALDNCAGLGSDDQTYTISSTGITAAGNSTWQFSGMGTADMSFSDSDSELITGTLDVSGAQSLTCDIDVSEQFQDTSTTSNGTSTVTGSGTITGTACGSTYNATVTFGTTPNQSRQRQLAFN